jgi:hypothetical protein
VEFRLLYTGELLPSGNSNKRTSEKHAIRQSFHPQLRRLWYTHPNLRKLAEHKGRMFYAEEIATTINPPQLSEDDAIAKGLKSMGRPCPQTDFRFVPLGTAEFGLRCSLDILLLRPEEDRFVFTQGDIDGQLKTLFDALRVPANLAEAGGVGPQDDETPFFCLLEDDRLISEVKVSADRLLLLPSTAKVKANDAFVVMTVRVTHKHPGMFDQWFA